MKKKLTVLFALIAILALGAALLHSFRSSAVSSSPLFFVSAEKGQVLVVHSLSRVAGEISAISKVKAVQEMLALTGLPEADALWGNAVSQLGFDPRKSDSLASVGIDGGKELAFISNASKSPAHGIGGDIADALILAIPVSDQANIQKWLNGRAQALLSASPAPGPNVHSGIASTVYSAQDGTVKLTAVLKDGYLYLSPSKNGSDALSLAFATAPEKSAAKSPDFADAKRALNSATMLGWRKYAGLSISAGINLKDLILDLRTHIAPAAPSAETGADAKTKTEAGSAKAQTLLRLISGLSAFQAAPDEMTSHLDPDAVFLAQSGILPSELLQIIRLLDGGTSRWIDRLLTPLRLSTSDIAEQLEPGIAVSLSIAPGGKIISLISSSAQRPSDFLNVFHMEALGQVRNPAEARAMLDRMATVAAASGLSIQRFNDRGEFIDNGPAPLSAAITSVAALFGFGKSREQDPNNAAAPAASSSGSKGGAADANADQAPAESQPSRWIFGLRQGTGIVVEISGKNILIAVGGKQVYDALKARNGSTDVSQNIGGSGTVLHFDIGKSIQSVREIPDSAYGLGGFAIKATLDKWLSAFDGVRNVRITASGDGRAVDFSASLSLTANQRQASAD